MPIDDAGKMSLLWNMINEYCDLFRNVLQGKYNNKNINFLEGEGGFKIKILYKKLLEDFTGDYKATARYTDENINYALTIHEGDSIPGFARFPQAINDMTDLISAYLFEERDKTKYLLDSIVDMEINYLFTNDYDYLNNFTTFIPKSNQIQNKDINNNINNNEIKPEIKIEPKTVFINEIRNRIEAYFKLIVRNLRDSVPKIIGKYLVKELEENMQIKLYNKLYNAKEMTDLLNEPESIAERRKELNDMIKVMKNAQKIIRRDPDLMSVMQININDNDINSQINDESKKNLEKKETKQNKKALKSSSGNDKTKAIEKLFG